MMIVLCGCMMDSVVVVWSLVFVFFFCRFCAAVCVCEARRRCLNLGDLCGC